LPSGISRRRSECFPGFSPAIEKNSTKSERAPPTEGHSSLAMPRQCVFAGQFEQALRINST